MESPGCLSFSAVCAQSGSLNNWHPHWARVEGSRLHLRKQESPRCPQGGSRGTGRKLLYRLPRAEFAGPTADSPFLEPDLGVFWVTGHHSPTGWLCVNQRKVLILLGNTVLYQGMTLEFGVDFRSYLPMPSTGGIDVGCVGGGAEVRVLCAAGWGSPLSEGVSLACVSPKV